MYRQAPPEPEPPEEEHDERLEEQAPPLQDSAPGEGRSEDGDAEEEGREESEGRGRKRRDISGERPTAPERRPGASTARRRVSATGEVLGRVQPVRFRIGRRAEVIPLDD
mmetsp:Transcript_15656/g.49918  ORF Transcript_15656/g.49918 Transcript_15656/m.49918 type:complete len:110 (+) Transcript_15656:77-406(+)